MECVKIRAFLGKETPAREALPAGQKPVFRQQRGGKTNAALEVGTHGELLGSGRTGVYQHSGPEPETGPGERVKTGWASL